LTFGISLAIIIYSRKCGFKPHPAFFWDGNVRGDSGEEGFIAEIYSA
jgi:hypothetical protein